MNGEGKFIPSSVCLFESVLLFLTGFSQEIYAMVSFLEHQKVRSKMESLDGIVPPSHGFMISNTAMKNVWLSMEHQVILWCNQLVVQVSHTLLSLVDTRTGKPSHDVRSRLAILTKMLHSGILQNIIPSRHSTLTQKYGQLHNEDRHVHSGILTLIPIVSV